MWSGYLNHLPSRASKLALTARLLFSLLSSCGSPLFNPPHRCRRHRFIDNRFFRAVWVATSLFCLLWFPSPLSSLRFPCIRNDSHFLSRECIIAVRYGAAAETVLFVARRVRLSSDHETERRCMDNEKQLQRVNLPMKEVWLSYRWRDFWIDWTD